MPHSQTQIRGGRLMITEIRDTPRQLDEILHRLTGAKQTTEHQWSAHCPAHDDRKASLSVKSADDGCVLLYCHAGCSYKAILSALGMGSVRLSGNKKGNQSCSSTRQSSDSREWQNSDDAVRELECLRGPCSTRWTYVDNAGEPIGIVLRWDGPRGKNIRPLARMSGKWRNRAMPAPRPLYCLPSLAGAPVVFVVEGEKAADALRALGLVATTSAGGAMAAKQSDWTPLSGITNIILPDADNAGRRYSDDVARLLSQLDTPTTIKILDLPGLGVGSGHDAVEFIAARRVSGHDTAAIRDELLQLAEAAPLWSPDQVAPAVATTDWEAPAPLGQFDLPPFPLAIVRGDSCPLWSFCTAISDSYQVPVDLPVMLALAVFGASLAKRCVVQVRPDWSEPLNLFVVIVMEPGERKSAVFREITAPFASFERDECDKTAPAIERNASEIRMLAAAVKHAEQEAAKLKDVDKREEARERAHELAGQLRDMPILVPLRMIADDATPEALANLLYEQSGRVALLSPEGGVFEQMAGRYSDGIANLDVYLKGHAGDDIRIHRISRPPEFVTQPALTVGLAVQPEVLRGLAGKPSFRGRGLLARFLYSLPASKVGDRSLNPAAVPELVRAAYDRCMQSALRLESTTDANGATVPHIIRPDRNALTVLDELRSQVEKSMREGGELIGIRDWSLKLPGAVVRIAGILHGLEHAESGRLGDIPLSAETMTTAVVLGQYLIEHAKAALFEIGADPSIGMARRLLDWMKVCKLRTFTRREAYRRLRGIIRSVDEVDRPLELLTSHGYIRQRIAKRDGPGRPPSQPFDVHPVILGQNGQNGQNSTVEDSSDHSVHCVPDGRNDDAVLKPTGMDHH